jgi:hypothetical protein
MTGVASWPSSLRRLRTAITSSPLVGSSSSTARPVHQRARQCGLGFCLREPFREAISNGCISSISMSSAARARLFPAQTMRLTEIGDILASREITVDAGAVRQHYRSRGEQRADRPTRSGRR